MLYMSHVPGVRVWATDGAGWRAEGQSRAGADWMREWWRCAAGWSCCKLVGTTGDRRRGLCLPTLAPPKILQGTLHSPGTLLTFVERII